MPIIFAAQKSADETVYRDGLIEPRQVINVGCPVPGILEQVAVERGETVKNGQSLATPGIDTRI